MKMYNTGIRSLFSAGFPAVILALSLFVGLAPGDDKKPKPAAPAKSSGAKPAASSSKSSGPTTASHGPTTTSHGPTTGNPSGHTTTTTAGHTTTTTTGAHTTTSTTGAHTTTSTTAGHTTTTTTGGRTTTSTTGGRATSTSTAGAHVNQPKGTGSPTPKTSKTVQTATGKTVTTRPGGKVASFNDPKRGMQVHNNLSGNRRVVVERPDHSRIVAERGGRGFVEHPYRFHGRDYARRSYFYHGHYYHAYYGRYYWHGAYMYPYYPTYYYGPAYYGWVYNPWAAPVPYAWGWAGNPWYGYYGAWFTPYPVYANAWFWLTDYMISNSLMAAYQAQAAQAAAMSGAAPLSPEAKQLIADEVRSQVALEFNEAKAGADAGTDPASTSIQRDLTDGKQHVFVAGQDVDVVDANGAECALSEGDAIQLNGPTAPDATSASLTVLASKGGKECAKGATVAVQLQDLQEMQNHMRQTIDEGMAELQKKQGQGGLPAAPAAARQAPVESAMAADAPPPPPQKDVEAEINQQSQEADRAEKEATGEAAGAASAAAPQAPEFSVEAGQTIEQVVAGMGEPLRKATVGSKTIYSYKDMKITFVDGKVADVQ